MQPADPGDALGELHLAVAGDTGDTDDLAAPDLEAHVVDGRHPVVAKHHEVTDRDPDGRIAEVPASPDRYCFGAPAAGSLRGAHASRDHLGDAGDGSASSPTMRVASSAADVSARRSVPTRLPSRMTVRASQTAIVSRILWVMKTTLMPSSTIARSDPNSESTSCGVRLVVGSSSTSTLAPR